MSSNAQNGAQSCWMAAVRIHKHVIKMFICRKCFLPSTVISGWYNTSSMPWLSKHSFILSVFWDVYWVSYNLFIIFFHHNQSKVPLHPDRTDSRGQLQMEICESCFNKVIWSDLMSDKLGNVWIFLSDWVLHSPIIYGSDVWLLSKVCWCSILMLLFIKIQNTSVFFSSEILMKSIA